jgi:hypothetical protein
MLVETGNRERSSILDYSPLDSRITTLLTGLLSILGLLFLTDIITTQIILRMGGMELNPFMAIVVANPVLHLGIKAAVLLVVFTISIMAEKRIRGSGLFFYGILIPFYICVVLNNMLVIVPHILK